MRFNLLLIYLTKYSQNKYLLNTTIVCVNTVLIQMLSINANITFYQLLTKALKSFQSSHRNFFFLTTFIYPYLSFIPAITSIGMITMSSYLACIVAINIKLNALYNLNCNNCCNLVIYD